MTYSFDSEVWQYPGMAAWHFASLPKSDAADIKERHGGKRRGWGSLPVSVRIGGSEWKTSIFPDKKSGTYILPIKADIRSKEGIRAGCKVLITISILHSNEKSS